MATKLTLNEAKSRFGKIGECSHDKDHEEKVNIPNTSIVQICCKACNKIKRTYYI